MNPAVPRAIARWHEIVASRDARGLDALLAEDVVFHSPVVHTPQAGKPVVTAYLAAAISVLGGETFRYLHEWYADRSAVLEFQAEIDGITVNGVDMIAWNDADRIVEFKVMIRPLKAIQLIHQRMAAALATAK
jgi:hypothetical protein